MTTLRQCLIDTKNDCAGQLAHIKRYRQQQDGLRATILELNEHDSEIARKLQYSQLTAVSECQKLLDAKDAALLQLSSQKDHFAAYEAVIQEMQKELESERSKNSSIEELLRCTLEARERCENERAALAAELEKLSQQKYVSSKENEAYTGMSVCYSALVQDKQTYLTPCYIQNQIVYTSLSPASVVNAQIPSSPLSYVRRSPVRKIFANQYASPEPPASCIDTRPVQQNNYIFVDRKDLKANFALYQTLIPYNPEYARDIKEVIEFVRKLLLEKQDDLSYLLNCDKKETNGMLNQLEANTEEYIFMLLKILMEEQNVGYLLAKINTDETNAAHLLACDVFLALLLGYEARYKPGLTMPEFVLYDEVEPDFISGW